MINFWFENAFGEFRVEWNGSATFNVYHRCDGHSYEEIANWANIDCFTKYDVYFPDEAYAAAKEIIETLVRGFEDELAA